MFSLPILAGKSFSFIVPLVLCVIYYTYDVNIISECKMHALHTFYNMYNLCKCNDFQVEEDEPTGYVRYEKFEPVMMNILMAKKLVPFC